MEQISLISELLIIGKVGLAMLLSGLIGYERELKDHSAGLRTHMLVGGSAALFVILGELITLSLLENFDTDVVNTDPVRIIQAVLVGVSFLGAGTILQNREDNRVIGLTTAASILFVSGIGVTVAISQYVMAIGVTVLVLIVLHLIKRLEHRLGI